VIVHEPQYDDAEHQIQARCLGIYITERIAYEEAIAFMIRMLEDEFEVENRGENSLEEYLAVLIAQAETEYEDDDSHAPYAIVQAFSPG